MHTDPRKVADLVRRLCGFFPRTAASNEEIFLAGLVQLLSAYPEWALNQACDVHHGLPSLHKFLPSIAEIREYLEALLAADRQHRELIERWTKPALRPPDPDRTTRSTYEALKTKHGEHWGVVNPDPMERGKQTAQQAEAKLRALIGDDAFDALPDGSLPQGTVKCGSTKVVEDLVPPEVKTARAEALKHAKPVDGSDWPKASPELCKILGRPPPEQDEQP
jgi:hypothetical protein